MANPMQNKRLQCGFLRGIIGVGRAHEVCVMWPKFNRV